MRLIDHTRELQVKGFGFNPSDLRGQERINWAKMMILGLVDEAMEALHELGWKHWKPEEKFNRDAFVEEVVDIVHFAAALALMAGVTDEEWERVYLSKSAVVLSRALDRDFGVE